MAVSFAKEKARSVNGLVFARDQPAPVERPCQVTLSDGQDMERVCATRFDFTQ
jgi:hypothetical protein